MPFVHGHPRDSGWVMSHYRRPSRAGEEQLDLDDTAVPPPRPAPDDSRDRDPPDHDPPDGAAPERPADG